MTSHSNYRYTDREKSWLAFNARVLQEAADETVPLLDRLRFLGIFSNNLDEFFRVRFAAIRRLSLSGESGEKQLGGISAQQLLKDITEIVIKQQAESLKILEIIEAKLKEKDVIMLHEKEVDEEQMSYIKDFFIQKVSPELVTIILNDLAEFPLLKDTSGYLAIKLVMKPKEKSKVLGLVKPKKEVRYALIEIPKNINRVVELPNKEWKQYIILLDDVIRLNLSNIFNIFENQSFSQRHGYNLVNNES
jgi:polyphosphate kinase